MSVVEKVYKFCISFDGEEEDIVIKLKGFLVLSGGYCGNLQCTGLTSWLNN
jgi:hypothetical protein